jgi:hypothetical protein
VQLDVKDSGDPGLPFDGGDIAAFGAGNEFERVVVVRFVIHVWKTNRVATT